MRKFLLSIAVALVASVQGLAIPALPTPFAVTQPDGSQLTVRLHGDEYYNYYTTLDGYTVVKNDAGYYVYAQKNGGVLAPTAVVARPQAERSAADLALLSTLGKNLIDDTRSSASRKARAQRDRAMKASAFDYSKFRGLVVLVQFNDCKFSRSDAADFYEKMINQENYTGYTNEDGSRSTYGAFTGSVRDYFSDNSMGKFNPRFDVVGPVTVNLSVDSPRGSENMSPLLAQSLKQLKGKVNFADYDTDNDGYVDMVYFIFAGVGSNTGEAPNHVWPHASYYSYPIGGKTIGRYACSCEFYSVRQGILDGIGTICHEFSHVLGLADLYDTDYSGSGGESVTPGTWEIMSGGATTTMPALQPATRPTTAIRWASAHPRLSTPRAPIRCRPSTRATRPSFSRHPRPMSSSSWRTASSRAGTPIARATACSSTTSTRPTSACGPATR
ncbi:MAG: M6 family metalloprotease domain-containing protein [Sodaliphilus pleomorphus]|uniref:M6 family metalloprotease domain-containing protein n=1 Tax=Sodaliphilus pleomorphus TaxID=2606626 RepID=UPI0024099E98|nr:M6 family metalloprotease domain-containing protein [Sodaliphilus pleomorphus]MDD6475419.1 M6 family metalloprotease domain-containing protein [Sodaliphilus pleomorphus]